MSARALYSFLTLLAISAATPACTIVTDSSGSQRMVFRNSVVALEQAEREAEAAEKAKNRAPSGHYLFVDDELLAALTPGETKIELNLTTQRARILDGQSRVVIETQISTGTSNHRTPTGTFKILEKIVDKSSNRYGRWVSSSTGATLVADGDSYKKPSGGAKFVGAEMPYWMRVTWYGIGMHIGYVPDYAASHGCIRVPAHIQPTIYSKVRVGTPVTIRY